jgi:hypothetical protein
MNTKSTSLLPRIGNAVLQLLPILVGGVFIFSGFVKAIDPLGFTYKIEDYLRAFGGVFQSLSSLAFPFAVLLSVGELLVGLGLVFRIFVKQAVLGALLFMIVMTPLTLYIALVNPVSDCGCFGDALIISNWATFNKNVAISLAVLFMLFNIKSIKSFFELKMQKIVFVLFILFGFGLSQYCYRHLPLIDFLPYKVGVNIPESMVVPQHAISDTYSTTFIYEKNGVQKEFTLENYPKDTTWKFIDQKSVLITKGYVPPIHDFSVVNAQYDDITERVLYTEGYSYLLVMYDIAKTSHEGALQAEKIYQIAKSKHLPFYALTGSSDNDVAELVKQTGVTFPFCKTDPTALKTIIRANPGLVLLKKGTVTGKWNWRDFQ